MRLVVISGRSGSGKSSVLHVLEDLGFYCIDNLPIGLLPALAEQANGNEKLTQIAVSVEARNRAHAVDRIELVLCDLAHDHYTLDVA